MDLPAAAVDAAVINVDTHGDEPIADGKKTRNSYGDGDSPGKIFVGGISKETTSSEFVDHFGMYGEITDSVIMKDRLTGHPRGFGFITFADPSVVDKVIEDTHVLNGKPVEIKRTIPKGATSKELSVDSTKDIRTRKIFVGGIPTTVNEDEFKEFFSAYGEVREHQIVRDHSSNRSRGFGFITFESEEVVDELLSNGNRVDFSGVQVEIKKAEPKKSAPPFRRHSDSRSSYGNSSRDSYGGYGGREGGGYGANGYKSGGPYSGRPVGGPYGVYGGGDFGGGYGVYGGAGMGIYRGDSSFGYSGRYGGGFGRGYDMGGYGGGVDGFGGYGAGGNGGYGSGYENGAGGGWSYGGGYENGAGNGYGGGGGSQHYGSRNSNGGSSGGRYHPYGR